MEPFIGRVEEKKQLSDMLGSGKPELYAIYGRRRVGKTFLVRRTLQGPLVFEFTGIHGATMKDQLMNFATALAKAAKISGPLMAPDSWQMAFYFPDTYLLEQLNPRKPATLLFDEFPWIHSPKSNFLRAFDHWWNTSVSQYPQLKVIICGSAASWMMKKVFKDRGGLHNRVTGIIRLMPFSPFETAAFLNSKGVNINRVQIPDVYIALGGIPYYLQRIKPGESAVQYIDHICFDPQGLLRHEFDHLYHALFRNADLHERIVLELSEKAKGLTRSEILKACGKPSGGTYSKTLGELEESGFLVSYFPYGKKNNDKLYRLCDEYSLFYLKFIAPNQQA